MSRSGEGRRVTAAILLLALLSVLYSLTPVHNANFFWHLRNGEDILDTGRIRTTDPFTHTMCGEEWLQQEWGAEVAMAAAWRALGEAGPVLLKALAVAAAVVLAGLEARRRGADWPALAAVGVLWLGLGHPRWIARPHIATIFFFAVYLFAEPRLRGRALPVRLAVFVPLQIVWANCHAGFIMGPFLLGLPVVDLLLRRRWKAAGRDLVLPAAALLASVVHPNGTGSLRYLTGFLSRPLFARTIREWWSPFDPRYQPGLPLSRTAMVLIALTLLAGFLLWRQRKRVRPSTVVGLAALTAASVMAARNIELLSLAGLAWLAPLASGRVRGSLAGALLAAAAAVPLLLGVPREVGPPRRLGASVDWSIYPRRTADFLEDHPGLLQGKLFNTHEVAGYLEYRFGSRLPLYMDGRCLLYPESFYAEYLALAHPVSRERALPVQAAVLLERDIDLAVVNWPSSEGSVAFLLADLPLWSPVHWDRNCVVYARSDLLASAGLDSLAFRLVDPLRPEELLVRPPYLYPSSAGVELARASRLGLDNASVLLCLLETAAGHPGRALRAAEGIADPDLRARLMQALSAAEASALPDSADPVTATAACWSLAARGLAGEASEAAALSGDPVLANASAVLAEGRVDPEVRLPWVMAPGMRALAEYPASEAPEALSARASALWCCGLRDSAAAVARRSIQADSTAPWQLASAAALQAMAGLDREATSTAERAVAARPTPFALYSLGIALRETGSGGRAAEALARSVRMAPRYRAAGLALADLLWRRGRMSAALDVYARIAEGNDALPEPAAARLRLARELGRAFLDRMAEAVKDSGT